VKAMSSDDQRSNAWLRVVATDDQGRGVRQAALVRWLESIAPRRARGTVSLALVPDRVMRRVNREFANHDYATDVLSFPADGSEAGYLGDILIATGVAARQAADEGHAVHIELRILALHGLLHLLGYDHASDTGQMARLEARLRVKGGLREGLIERAREPRPSARARARVRPKARRAEPGGRA
jgi:probable rRNA maturation factor